MIADEGCTGSLLNPDNLAVSVLAKAVSTYGIGLHIRGRLIRSPPTTPSNQAEKARMTFDARSILDAVLPSYALELDGIHGVAHWARVMENGRCLAEETGADAEVVRLFALFHDSRRINDGTDPYHGSRAANFARTLRGRVFKLSHTQFRRLDAACTSHTHGRTHPDKTVRTCWDADRLDLGRVGITPLPRLLCTKAARLQDTIHWAHERAVSRLVPEFVQDWGIDLAASRSVSPQSRQ
jgi:uncharacterized protein